MKRLVLVGVLCGLITIGLGACSPKQQEDCGFVQNAYGERISWKGRLPIVMRLHESVPKEYEEAAVQAAESWNRSLGKTVLSVDLSQRETGAAEARKDTVNTIYFYPTWEADRPSEQARTSIYWKGDLIEEADIRVNKVNFTFYQLGVNDKQASSNSINIEALLIHEMGHVLGLRHNDANPSVMGTYLSAQSNRLELTTADVKSLKCEY